MPDFDPDAYLAQKQPAFDPDAYLSSKTQPSPTPQPTFAAGSPREIAHEQLTAQPVVQQQLERVGRAVGQTAVGLVKGLPQMAKFIKPPSLVDVLGGAVETVGQMKQAVNAPVGSQDWWNAVVPLGAQAAMEIGGVRASSPGLHETLFGEKPPVQPLASETAAAKEVINNATQEGVVKEGGQPEHPRDDTSGTPAETSGSSGVKPSTQAPQEKVATAPEAFPSLLQSAEDARRAELRQEPEPVSEPTETTTAQPLTQEKGGEVGEKVQVQGQDEGKGKEGVLTPGAATVQPPAAPESEGRTTGIAQRITGVPAGEGMSVQESVNRGSDLISKGVNPEEVSSRIRFSGQVGVDDLSVLRARTAELDKSAYQAEDAYRANPTPENKQNWDTAVQTRNQWNTEHVKPAQTIWSNLGRVQQGESDIDTGTVTGLRVAFHEAKGRDATTSEQAKLSQIADQTQKVNQDIDQAKQQYDQEVSKTTSGRTALTAEQLQEHFANRITDPFASKFKFTQDEIGDVLKYAKDNYIDQGVTSLDDTIHMVAIDTGLNPNWVADVLTKTASVKNITNEMYSKMANRRNIKNAARDYIYSKDEPRWKKIIRGIWETPFSLAVYGHGTVGGITHAGANIFRPTAWNTYWPHFIEQAKFFAKPSIHEQAMQMLVRDSDTNFFTIAKRGGLANDPNLTYTDYGTYAKFFGMQGGRRGFDALKTMRQGMFNDIWKSVPQSIKNDPQAALDMSKNYSDMLNHGTGAIAQRERGFLPTAARATGNIAFAAKLEASRWARIIGDPLKTFDTYARWNQATPGEKAVAQLRTRHAAEFVGTFLGSLYLNQAILSASNSKEKINFTDPSKSDWLKHKIAGHTVAVDGGLLSPVRLLGRLVYDELIRPRKELRGQTRTSAGLEDIGQYAMGKAAPAVGMVKEAVSGESFAGQLMPWSRDTPTVSRPRMSWTEYATSHGPIPLSGAVQDIYSQLREKGMTKPDAETLLRGLGAFGAELTGARITEAPEERPPRQKQSRSKTPLLAAPAQ